MQTTAPYKQSESGKENKDFSTSTHCSGQKSPKQNPSSAIAECHQPSKKKTSQDKSRSCGKNSPKQKSCRTSVADSTSKEKDLKPYYNDFCKEISSRLLSHTEIDSAASVTTSSNSFLRKMVENSWFSITNRYLHNENSQKICLQFFTSFLAECTGLAVTQTSSRKIRLYLTHEQRIELHRWFGVARKFYNLTVEYLNNLKEGDTVNWMEIFKMLSAQYQEEYIKSVPFQIKKQAVHDACKAFYNGVKKAKKTGEAFRLDFRTRKDVRQNVYILKEAITKNGIYYTKLGNIKFSEKDWIDGKFGDCRLIREYRRYYLYVPVRSELPLRPVSENQTEGDVVALDPGIRTFMTYFSENGHFGKLGEGIFKDIMSLNYRIDKLQSRIAEAKKAGNKKNARNLYRAVGNLRMRISNLIDELHYKVINFLVRNFSVILLPTFETSGMVGKEKNGKKRKINKSVVRSMLGYRFYDFGQRLADACKKYGVRLLRVNEAYTSRTNSFTGELINIGSRKSFQYDGIKVDRDINGARGILLRAVRDGSANR